MKGNLRSFSVCVLAAFMFGLAGCTSVDMSKHEPFASYVGREVQLQQPAAVVERRSMWMNSYPRGVKSLRSAKRGLKLLEGPLEVQLHETDKEYARLPVGHPVRLDRVLYEYHIDSQHFMAFGRTTVPPGTNEVTFACLWNYHAAPWEPSDATINRELPNYPGSGEYRKPWVPEEIEKQRQERKKSAEKP